MKSIPSNLQKAGDTGANNAAKALSQLAHQSTKVITSEIKQVPISDATKVLQPEGEVIVVYSQAFQGESQGVSLVVIPRHEALALVDLLSGRAVGTTKIMKEIDRSALKELTNILSNAYLTAICSQMGTAINLSAPNLTPSARIAKLIETLKATKKGEAILFKTVIEMTTHKIKTNLFLLFHFGLVEIIK